MNSESTKARAGYVSQRFSEVAFVCETGMKEYESKQKRIGHRMLEGLREANEKK